MQFKTLFPIKTRLVTRQQTKKRNIMDYSKLTKIKKYAFIKLLILTRYMYENFYL